MHGYISFTLSILFPECGRCRGARWIWAVPDLLAGIELEQQYGKQTTAGHGALQPLAEDSGHQPAFNVEVAERAFIPQTAAVRQSARE